MFLQAVAVRFRVYLILPVVLAGLSFFFMAQHANAKACSPEIYAALHSASTDKDAQFEIQCDITLSKGDVISKRLLFSGAASSGATLDCKGATIDGSQSAAPTITIRSSARSDGTWNAPSGITIRDCTINGDIRLLGMRKNGADDLLLRSSLQRGHTERAQAAAPSNITLTHLNFVGQRRIPIYAWVGTTGLTVTDSTFAGSTDAIAIYLDAESAGNTITNNTFSMTTKKRELIAVDGSAHNTIADNVFENPINGGIFVYRNCGEKGMIRHQPPQYNKITDNIFHYTGAESPKPAIWLDSRKGKSRFCFKNPAYPFGSSLNNLDLAKFNTVSGNKLPGGSDALILNDDPTNKISNNH